MKNAHNVLLGFVAFALAIMAPVSAFAQTEADFEVTLTEDGTGAVITKYTGDATVVKIPATIQGMPVKEIGGHQAFYRDSPSPYRKGDPDKRITAVTFPAGLVKIGERAFYGSRLMTVVIPNGVTEIGESAFSGCEGLTTVSLPDTLTDIGMSAFDGCTSLRSITLPQNLTYLGRNAFRSSGLTSITLPGSLGELDSDDLSRSGKYGDSCFARCPNLTTVIISEGITELGAYMFNNCKTLASVALPSTIGYGTYGDDEEKDLVNNWLWEEEGYNWFFGEKRCYGYPGPFWSVVKKFITELQEKNTGKQISYLYNNVLKMGLAGKEQSQNYAALVRKYHKTASAQADCTGNRDPETGFSCVFIVLITTVY